MKRQYSLKIDNPCKQDWALMTGDDGKRYCTHCSKFVTDFTGLTDKQIIEILDHASGTISGRLMPDQLNRTLVEYHKRKNFPFLQKLLTGLFFVGTVDNSFAIDRMSKVKTEGVFIGNYDDENRWVEQSGKQTSYDNQNFVFGRIVDSATNEAILAATIYIKGSKQGTVSDVDGKFKLLVPEHLISEKMIFIISALGYRTVEKIIRGTDLTFKKELVISVPLQGTMGLMEVVIVKKKKWWQIWKRR